VKQKLLQERTSAVSASAGILRSVSLIFGEPPFGSVECQQQKGFKLHDLSPYARKRDPKQDQRIIQSCHAVCNDVRRFSFMIYFLR